MLNILLLPLLGGYLYLSVRHRHRALILRQSSYHLFFKAAVWGIIFFVSARLVVLTVAWASPEAIGLWEWLENRFVPEPFRPYAGTAFLSLLIGVVLSRALNYTADCEAEERGNPFWGSEEYEAYRAIELRGNGVERLVTHAFQYNEFLSVTLVTNKYYIGYVSQIPEPSREYTSLELVPVSSGYRDPTTKLMNETDNYADVLSTLSREGPSPGQLINNDFTVVLPIGQIASMKLFDPDVFQAFQQHRTGVDITAPGQEP